MNDLKGKVALVTGASKGIGAAIARALAAAGATVGINYVADAAAANANVGAIVSAGGRATAIQGDVSKSADVKRIFASLYESFDRLDIVVNNAGVYTFEPIERVTEAEFHREFDTNVLAAMLTTQEALHYFSSAGGSIINVSSIVSKNPAPASAIYASTKGAVDTLTGVLAKELGDRKIRVNAIAPGVTMTEGLQESGVPGSPFEAQMIGMTPLGRIGMPTDIAPLVVFLASDAAAWITGERITISGGLR